MRGLIYLEWYTLKERKFDERCYKTKVERRKDYVGTALEHHNDCSDHQVTSSNTIMETRLKLHEVELDCL